MTDLELDKIINKREIVTIDELRLMSIEQLNQYTAANNKRYRLYSEKPIHLLSTIRDEFKKICKNGEVVQLRHNEIINGEHLDNIKENEQ